MLKMNAVGDIGSVYSDWERGADELLELKAEEDSGATFTLSYLRDIINSAGVSTEVATLELTTARARGQVSGWKVNRYQAGYS